MVQYHKEPKTKASGTGGKRRAQRDKLLAHFGGFFSRTHYSKEALKETREVRRSKGGSVKQAAKVVLYVNVAVSGGLVKKAKILNVVETPDNRNFSRENLLTKGAIVDTDLGRVRISSRPGQSGTINAIFVEAKAPAPAKKEHAKPKA